MKYREFGSLGWEVSALGFGAMRLPLLDKDPAQVDEAEAVRMIRHAIDNGVSYVDSAYMYHGGTSEVIVGRALEDGYRDKVRVATKLPPRNAETSSDFDRLLNEQLGRLQTDHVDVYLLHGMNRHAWPRLRDMGIIPWAESAMADGRIGCLGFSFHDDLPAFKDIVDGYDNWAMCQVQYNFMDTEHQAGTEGVQYAAGKGLAVVVMEPLRGGKLGKAPEAVANVWADAPRRRSPAEWALLWALNQPEVTMALSGMSTMEQVVENLDVASRSEVGILTGEEMALYDRVREAYYGLSPIPCTSCGYCLPCPSGVAIPRVFQVYNESIMYDDPRTGRFRYRGPGGITEGERADQCTECGECVMVCPQEIDIPEWMKTVHELLGPRDAAAR